MILPPMKTSFPGRRIQPIQKTINLPDDTVFINEKQLSKLNSELKLLRETVASHEVRIEKEINLKLILMQIMQDNFPNSVITKDYIIKMFTSRVINADNSRGNGNTVIVITNKNTKKTIEI